MMSEFTKNDYPHLKDICSRFIKSKSTDDLITVWKLLEEIEKKEKSINNTN